MIWLGGRGVAHEGGELLRPEAELVIEGDVLGAVGKGEECSSRKSGFVEDLHSSGEEFLRDTPVPVGGQNREWPEEGEASPDGEDVDADEATVLAGCQGFHVPSVVAAGDEIAVGHKRSFRNAEEGCEGETEDAIGFGELGLFKGTDFDLSYF